MRTAVPHAIESNIQCHSTRMR